MPKRSKYFPNTTSRAVPRDNGTSTSRSHFKGMRTANSYGNRLAVKCG